LVGFGEKKYLNPAGDSKPGSISLQTVVIPTTLSRYLKFSKGKITKFYYTFQRIETAIWIDVTTYKTCSSSNTDKEFAADN
jgi:hypothetical protein